jgi:hypothetical protein
VTIGSGRPKNIRIQIPNTGRNTYNVGTATIGVIKRSLENSVPVYRGLRKNYSIFLLNCDFFILIDRFYPTAAVTAVEMRYQICLPLLALHLSVGGEVQSAGQDDHGRWDRSNGLQHSKSGTTASTFLYIYYLSLPHIIHPSPFAKLHPLVSFLLDEAGGTSLWTIDLRLELEQTE